MNGFLYDLKAFVYETFVMCGDFLKNYNLPVILLILALAYVIFLRRQNLKRVLMFYATLSLLFIFLVRLESFFVQTFGAESSQIGIAIGRVLFIIISGIILIYHSLDR